MDAPSVSAQSPRKKIRSSCHQLLRSRSAVLLSRTRRVATLGTRDEAIRIKSERIRVLPLGVMRRVEWDTDERPCRDAYAVGEGKILEGHAHRRN